MAVRCVARAVARAPCCRVEALLSQRDSAAAELATAKGEQARLQAAVLGALGRTAQWAGTWQSRRTNSNSSSSSSDSSGTSLRCPAEQHLRLRLRSTCCAFRLVRHVKSLQCALFCQRSLLACPPPLHPPADLKQQAHQMRRMLQQLQGEKEAAQGQVAPLGRSSRQGAVTAVLMRACSLTQRTACATRVPCNFHQLGCALVAPVQAWQALLRCSWTRCRTACTLLTCSASQPAPSPWLPLHTAAAAGLRPRQRRRRDACDSSSTLRSSRTARCGRPLRGSARRLQQSCSAQRQGRGWRRAGPAAAAASTDHTTEQRQKCWRSWWLWSAPWQACMHEQACRLGPTIPCGAVWRHELMMMRIAQNCLRWNCKYAIGLEGCGLGATGTTRFAGARNRCQTLPVGPCKGPSLLLAWPPVTCLPISRVLGSNGCAGAGQGALTWNSTHGSRSCCASKGLPGASSAPYAPSERPGSCSVEQTVSCCLSRIFRG